MDIERAEVKAPWSVVELADYLVALLEQWKDTQTALTWGLKSAFCWDGYLGSPLVDKRARLKVLRSA